MLQLIVQSQNELNISNFIQLDVSKEEIDSAMQPNYQQLHNLLLRYKEIEDRIGRTREKVSFAISLPFDKFIPVNLKSKHTYLEIKNIYDKLFEQLL